MRAEPAVGSNPPEWIEIDPRYEIRTVGPLQQYTWTHRTEWWGRVALWFDTHLNHPLVLNAGWQSWVPVRIGEALVWPFYRFCVWCAQWDEPLPPSDPRWDA